MLECSSSYLPSDMDTKSEDSQQRLLHGHSLSLTVCLMSAHEGEGEQTPQQMGEIHPLGDIGELNLNSLDTKIFQMALAISANI